MTPLDTAHAAMDAAPDDEGLRMAYYARLAESELFLLLESDAGADAASPRVYGLDSGDTVLAFDSDARLAEFAGAAPFLALPGRRLMAMLAGQGLALGVNLGVAASAFLMPAGAVDWLADRLESAPGETLARIEEVSAPAGLPDALIAALDRKLARAAGLAAAAYLAAVRFRDGRRGHVLAIVDAAPGAETALAAEMSEALAFSGLDAASLDVTFVGAADPATERLARVGLRFDLPTAEPTGTTPAAPGMDPDRPPKLT